MTKHFYLVGVLCAVFQGPASAETNENIEIYSCNATDLQVGTGADLICVPMDWLNDPGQTDDDDPFDGPADEYNKGSGKTKTKTKTKPDTKNASDEVKRKATCKACKIALTQCNSKANSEFQRCQTRAAARAEEKCNINKQNGPGWTPWGCTTNDLYEKACTTVEAPWNDPNRWIPGGDDTKYYCEQSWRVPHSGGTSTVSDSSGFSVSFKGVGATKGSTMTSTYQFTSLAGWGAACVNVSNELGADCDDAAKKCFDENDCTEEERK